MYKLTRVETLDQVEPYIDKTIEYINKALTQAPEVTFKWVNDNIMKGNSQLWLATHDKELVGIVVTNGVFYPTTSRLLIHLLGGVDIHNWVGTISEIEAWAKQQGLDGIEIQGRRGWLKLLPDYKCNRVLLTKEFAL